MLWATVVCLALVALWAQVRKHVIHKELNTLEAACKPVPSLAHPKVTNDGTKIAVVTGGCGFLGQHVVHALAYGGYYTTIRVFDRMSAVGRFTLPNGVTIESVVGDVVDGGALLAAFADAEAVFHLAALVDTRYGEIIRNRLWHVNVKGTEAVIAACQSTGVSRLVFTSSFAATFLKTSTRHDIVWDETNADFGTNVSSQLFVYGRSKAASELLVKAAQGVKGLNVVILRPNYIIGPGDIASKLIVQSGKPLPLMGNATSITTTIYVKNAAAWLTSADAALQDPKKCAKVAGRAFFIGDCDKTVREMEWRGSTGSTQPFVESRIPTLVAWFLGYFINFLDALTWHQLDIPLMSFSSGAVHCVLSDQRVCFDAALKLFNYKPAVHNDDVVEDFKRSVQSPLILLKKASV